VELDISLDLNLYKHAILWIVRNGDTGYPRYGNTNVFCFMPRTANCLKLEDCIKNNDVVYIDPGEKIKTWMNFKVRHLL
jgi:hypothetical protein